MDITVELNQNQEVLVRNVYTILDVLSDIGGMQSFICSGFSLILACFNYKNLDNYMASHLYRIKNKKEQGSGNRRKLRKKSLEDNDIESKELNSTEIRPTRYCNWFEYLSDLFKPCLSYCFRPCKK